MYLSRISLRRIGVGDSGYKQDEHRPTMTFISYQHSWTVAEFPDDKLKPHTYAN